MSRFLGVSDQGYHGKRGVLRIKVGMMEAIVDVVEIRLVVVELW